MDTEPGQGLVEQQVAATTAVASPDRESVEWVAQEPTRAAAELLGITDEGMRWMVAHERVLATRCGPAGGFDATSFNMVLVPERHGYEAWSPGFVEHH